MPSIPPISKGLPVLEKATNFLSGQFLRWLQSVESRLNKAVVTDVNGNIAYGGATIPTDVYSNQLPTLDVLQYFYKGPIVKVFDGTNNVYNITNNAYLKYTGTSADWAYIDDGQALLTQFRNDTSAMRIYKSASGLAGGTISFTEIFRVDQNGNVNIKTGSTYTATL